MTATEASFALQVVKWLDAPRAGTGRGALHYGAPKPTMEEVKAEILARSAHRATSGRP